MAYNASAARTNLTSTGVRIDRTSCLGEGCFRLAYAGTFVGGNRNSQEAVCKCFKHQYRPMEDEYYDSDEMITDRAIEYANSWNQFSAHEILVTQGSVFSIDGLKYMVEPLIRNFTKFTSNNGWIASEDEEGWCVLAMEAFSHYTYHKSGGQLVVCDLQGRYKANRFNRKKARFELTDPAICSRRRLYGPTDLGEKGIESFFVSHVCNHYCHVDGKRWARPRSPTKWFVAASATSMMSSIDARKLLLNHPARFNSRLEAFNEYDDSDSDSY
jgi:Alpha-kinase family